MKRPAFLTPGDKLAIVAPGSKVEKQAVLFAKEVFESWGLVVELGTHCFSSFHRYAGSDQDRAEDLQQYFQDTTIKAIICARGGYGCVRILEYLDFSTIQSSPKWLVGYSDVTVFHSYFNKILQIESIHASMPINFREANEQSLESLRQALFGELTSYNFPPHPLNSQGFVQGELIGGNLATLLSLSASPYDMDTNNKILFIEDIGEQYYAIDRMMMNLKIAGKLSKVKGVIVGYFTNCEAGNPAYGKSIYEIVREHLKEDIPVAFGFNAGHDEPNLAIYLGRTVELNVEKHTYELRFL